MDMPCVSPRTLLSHGPLLHSQLFFFLYKSEACLCLTLTLGHELEFWGVADKHLVLGIPALCACG